MRRPEKLDPTKKHRKIDPTKVSRDAYSIPEFCASHRISEMTFFRMKRQGQAPKTMKVGTRTLISVEAATAWRREREIAAQEVRYLTSPLSPHAAGRK
jgi:hypothetical protein